MGIGYKHPNFVLVLGSLFRQVRLILRTRQNGGILSTCETTGCENPVHSRGMCSTCYSRWYRAKRTREGDPVGSSGPHAGEGKGWKNGLTSGTDAGIAAQAETMKGPKNPAWKGGITFLNRKTREMILRRAGGKCERCGEGPNKGSPYPNLRQLHVHHKDRNRSNNSPDNLEALCQRCHTVNEHAKERLAGIMSR